MGRRPMGEDQKRRQIAVRLNPKDRARFEQIAGAEGTSVGAEVEQYALDQLAYVEGTDPETRELLAKILDNLTKIRTSAKGRWHSSLTAWSAASEMLAHILDDRRPAKDRPIDDEQVAPALRALSDAQWRRGEIVRELLNIGIAVRDDPAPLLLGARGGGLFGMSGSRSSREWESAALEALPDDMKAKAKPLFDELLEVDKAVAAAREQWNEAMRPFWEAEEAGRRIGQSLAPEPEYARIARSLAKAPRLSR